MFSVLIRTVIIYVALILIMRFLGKRQIGELQLSELVTALLLSEVASQPLTNASAPLLYAVAPVLVLVSLEVILSFVCTKSALAKSLLEGKPSMIINRGNIQQKEMLKVRMTAEDLLSALRLKNIPSLDQVEYAFLEQNGQLSVFPKPEYKPATTADVNANFVNDTSHAVIIDGKTVIYALDFAEKSEDWAYKELSKRGISVKEVFLMTVDDEGKVKLVKKDGSKKKK